MFNKKQELPMTKEYLEKVSKTFDELVSFCQVEKDQLKGLSELVSSIPQWKDQGIPQMIDSRASTATELFERSLLVGFDFALKIKNI
jgi:hypothetical protein